jgi:FkbM family methyltransferase
VRQALRSGVVSALRTGVRLSGGRMRRLLSDALREDEPGPAMVTETVATSRGAISFCCIGGLPLWRARTLLTKEPETIEWIDGFAAGDTFWDVGANVGIYSLYAAINRTIRVLAFEPSAGNYFLLNRNIEINGLDGSIQAFCIAFADEKRTDALNMQSTELGGALSSFADPIDNFGRRFVPRFRQGMIGYAIDSFIEEFKPPFPNHLKIDVDGLEERIVAGAAATLADPRLKSLSIELDSARPDETDPITARIEQAGLRLTARRQSEMVASGEYGSIFNYQFHRIAS